MSRRQEEDRKKESVMVIFYYDKTFEGLLTAVFEAYSRRTFPDKLLVEGEVLPLFYDEVFTVVSDPGKSDRVWKALQKKLSAVSLSRLTLTWLSELPGSDMLLFRYIRKVIDSPRSVETDFGDPDVLEMSKIWKKVGNERGHVVQFLRFQKTADGIFFAALSPLYNVLPLTVSHLKDRFADQRWLLYDLKREYGYYYDLKEVSEIRFEEKEEHLLSGWLNEELMDKDEKLFQSLWSTYFRSIAIKERINPKLHRQMMPARFWPNLTEKRTANDPTRPSRRD